MEFETRFKYSKWSLKQGLNVSFDANPIFKDVSSVDRMSMKNMY